MRKSKVAENSLRIEVKIPQRLSTHQQLSVGKHPQNIRQIQESPRPQSYYQPSQQQGDEYMGINQIMMYSNKNAPNIFYVPCYLRMRIDRVNQINYIESKAEIQTQIRLWVMIKQLPKAVQEEVINLTKLQINSTNKYLLADMPQPPKLDSTYIKNTSRRSKGFILSQSMTLDIQSDAFWSPFQLIKLVANLEIKKIQLGDYNSKFWEDLTLDDQRKYRGATIQFNFLDAHPFLQFSFGEVRHLGSFDIAQNLVDMKFTNDAIRTTDDEQQQQINEDEALNLMVDLINLRENVKKQKLQEGQATPDAYEHGQILIPLYKYPSTTIINVFVPFYIVAIMNLGVFFQDNDMSNRDSSLATFQLAYIAFFPTIRSNLPDTPKLVFAQILIYIQAICTIICFFYSLSVNQLDDYVFTWNQDPYFLTCLSLTILNICTVIGMFLMHKLVWERRYNKLPKGSHKYLNCKSLNTDDETQWWNQDCEKQFSSSINMGIVRPLFPMKKKKRKDPIISALANIFREGREGGREQSSQFSSGNLNEDPSKIPTLQN